MTRWARAAIAVIGVIILVAAGSFVAGYFSGFDGVPRGWQSGLVVLGIVAAILTAGVLVAALALGILEWIERGAS